MSSTDERPSPEMLAQIAQWREGTERLTGEVTALRASIDELATMDDLRTTRRSTLRRTYGIAGAILAAVLLLGIGAAVAAVTYRDQQEDFRQSTYHACVMRNEAERARMMQNAVVFQALIDGVQDPALHKSLETFRDSYPDPVQPNCHQLLG